MPEDGVPIIATRIALLELRDEHRLVQEGYELLDEKRMMLAAEILRELRRHGELERARLEHEREARTAYGAAVEAHGFEDLTTEPRLGLEGALLRRERRLFLGIGLVEAALEAGEPTFNAAPILPSPELRRCALAYRHLVADHAALAAIATNLRRLVREYVRTERRARALENVLLPEIDASLRFVEEQLDAVDQEEAVRVRNAARSGAAPEAGHGST
ncbi:MAG TPA: V-type ATP synthase subunit D [Steroidobacteraceae bacterium]|nr:V-type ATP synthase subunit D [Steroidobacteraceae bacterium]